MRVLFLPRASSAIALTALSGLLTGASGIFPPLWPLAFAGPAIFLFVLFYGGPAHSLRRLLFLGLLFGFIQHLFAYGSFLDTYPLSWAGIGGFLVPHIYIAAAWMAGSFAAALPWGLFAGALGACARRWRDPLVLILCASGFWVLTELLSAFLSSLASWGNGSLISFDYTIGALGYALAHGPSEVLLLPARLGGVALLSANVVATSALLARFARVFLAERSALPREAMAAGAIFVALVAPALLAYADLRAQRGQDAAWKEAGELRVVLVSTDFPSTLRIADEEKEKRRGSIEEALSGIAGSGFAPDLVAFPEGTRIAEYVPGYAERLSAYLPEDALVLDSGYRYRFPGGKVLETRAYRVGGSIEGRIDKQILVPFGEYVPRIFELAGKLLAPEIIDDLLSYRTYEIGGRAELAQAKGIPIGARLCSEVFSPRLYRELREGGAGLLLDLSSVAMFHGSPRLLAQIAAAARVRAVENGLPMAIALNGGAQKAYDCAGREIVPERVENSLHFYRFSVSTACPR